MLVTKNFLSSWKRATLTEDLDEEAMVVGIINLSGAIYMKTYVRVCLYICVCICKLSWKVV